MLRKDSATTTKPTTKNTPTHTAKVRSSNQPDKTTQEKPPPKPSRASRKDNQPDALHAIKAWEERSMSTAAKTAQTSVEKDELPAAIDNEADACEEAAPKLV